MKAASGCKLFGAQQALSGVRDGVLLLHSVVGCGFGSTAFHFGCDMGSLRQSCTVISDSDVVFGGEDSLERALGYAEELYRPQVIFVVTGCVSDIVQDDAAAVIRRFRGCARVVWVEAAGYRGDLKDGYEAGLLALADLMEPQPPDSSFTVNLLGLGADDHRVRQEIAAVRGLMGPPIRIGAVFSGSGIREIAYAPSAQLNLVFGRGIELAREMRRRFGIPYEELDYPYGITGAEALWEALSRRFALDFSPRKKRFLSRTAEGLRPLHGYLQALHGMPAAVIASRARCRGMARFLSEELGMEVVCRMEREEIDDLDEAFDRIRAGEAAVLFGSSFEAELADELAIPLLRFDYPVFDRFCVSDRPYIGAKGTLCLVEDLLNEIIGARSRKGALYQ